MTGRRIRVSRSVCVCASSESVGESVRHPSLSASASVKRHADARLRSSVRVTPSESIFHPSHGISVDSSCTPREQQSQALIQSSRPSFRVTCSEPLFPSHLLRAARFKSFFSATLSESQLGVVTELLGGPDVLPSPLADRIAALRARLAARLGQQRERGGGGSLSGW